MSKFTLRLHEEDREIETHRQGNTITVEMAGQVSTLRILHQDGPYLLLEYITPDGQHHRLQVAGHKEGDERQVWLNGRTFTYQRLRQGGAAAGPASAGSLAASIPAVVSQILVNVGDTVAAGDKLILLESMKMVIPIQAPYDGTVTAVNCSNGQAVQPSNPLVELDET